MRDIHLRYYKEIALSRKVKRDCNNISNVTDANIKS